MKIKIQLLFLCVLTQVVISAQNGNVEIKGQIEPETATNKPLWYFIAKVSIGDSLTFTDACDSNGNFKILVPEKLIKSEKTIVSVYQDANLVKKNYPSDVSCPFIYSNGEAYASPAPQTLAYKSGASVYPVSFILTQSCMVPKMNGIGFKQFKTDLEYYKGLNSDTTLICIAGTMKQNPSMVVEVVGFAWREKHDQVLSEKRAQYIKSRLVKLGVDSVRILTRGMGERQPVATTIAVNSVNNSREQILKLFAINRRVEIYVLAFDFDPKSKKRK